MSLQSTSMILVREVLSACQGINGRHVTVAEGDDGETKIDQGIGIPVPERQLMTKLAELGWLFRCALSLSLCSFSLYPIRSQRFFVPAIC